MEEEWNQKERFGQAKGKRKRRNKKTGKIYLNQIKSHSSECKTICKSCSSMDITGTSG